MAEPLDPRLTRLLDEFEDDRNEGRSPKVLHEKIDRVIDTVEQHGQRITKLETHRERDAEDKQWGPNGTGRFATVPSIGTPAIAFNVTGAAASTPTTRPTRSSSRPRPTWVSDAFGGAMKKVAPFVGAVLASWGIGHFLTGPAGRGSTAAAEAPPSPALTATSVAPSPDAPDASVVDATAAHHH